MKKEYTRLEVLIPGSCLFSKRGKYMYKNKPKSPESIRYVVNKGLTMFLGVSSLMIYSLMNLDSQTINRKRTIELSNGETSTIYQTISNQLYIKPSKCEIVIDTNADGVADEYVKIINVKLGKNKLVPNIIPEKMQDLYPEAYKKSPFNK